MLMKEREQLEFGAGHNRTSVWKYRHYNVPLLGSRCCPPYLWDMLQMCTSTCSHIIQERAVYQLSCAIAVTKKILSTTSAHPCTTCSPIGRLDYIDSHIDDSASPFRHDLLMFGSICCHSSHVSQVSRSAKSLRSVRNTFLQPSARDARTRLGL